MPGYRTHITLAIFTFPLITLLYKGVLLFFKGSALSWEMVVFGLILYTLSSELPDIDHKQAYSNRFFRFFLWIAITAVFYKTLSTSFFYYLPYYFDFWIEEIFLIFSIFFGWILSKICLFLLPAHRGPIHTVWVGLLIASILTFLYWYLYENSGIGKQALSRTVFFFLCTFCGYLHHLFLDFWDTRYKSSFFRRKKSQ